MTVRDRLCIVGFGDVGFHWTRTLLEAGYDPDDLVVLYLPHDGGGLARAQAKAEDLGVSLVAAPDQVPDGAHLYFHATTASGSEDVLDRCLPHLSPEDVWVDVNSTGPAAQERMAALAAGSAVAFVDAAIMAPASKLGHRTPVWAAGPGTPQFAAWAERWDMPTVLIEGGPGAAAAIKMCTNLIVKGLAASLVEGLAVAEVIGVQAHVRDSLADYLGQDLVDSFSQRFIRPTMQHAARRAAEVEQAVEMGEHLGWDALNGRGVAAFLGRIAQVGGADIAERHEDQAAILREFSQAYSAWPQQRQEVSE